GADFAESPQAALPAAAQRSAPSGDGRRSPTTIRPGRKQASARRRPPGDGPFARSPARSPSPRARQAPRSTKAWRRRAVADAGPRPACVRPSPPAANVRWAVVAHAPRAPDGAVLRRVGPLAVPGQLRVAAKVAVGRAARRGVPGVV